MRRRPNRGGGRGAPLVGVVFFSLFGVATFTVYCKKSVNGDDFMVVQLGQLERCR